VILRSTDRRCVAGVHTTCDDLYEQKPLRQSITFLPRRSMALGIKQKALHGPVNRAVVLGGGQDENRSTANLSRR